MKTANNKRSSSDLTRRVSFLADDVVSTSSNSSSCEPLSVIDDDHTLIRACKKQRIFDSSISLPPLNAAASLSSISMDCDVATLRPPLVPSSQVDPNAEEGRPLTGRAPTPETVARHSRPHLITPRCSIRMEVYASSDSRATASRQGLAASKLANTLDELSADDELEGPVMLIREKPKSSLLSKDELDVSTDTVAKVSGPKVSVHSFIACGFLLLLWLLTRNSGEDLPFRKHVPVRTVGEDSVYVPGGGFSGFWFTLGRLRSISDPASRTYFCYSAGCLGVVATLRHYTMEEMYSIASGIQDLWRKGHVGRYDVVDEFLGELLAENHTNALNAEMLQRMNIITSVKHGYFGLKPVITTPSSVHDLRKLLIQTTWIPFATGSDLWHHGHMDGAFTSSHHPRCHHDVGLLFDIDLLANFINVNLSRNKVKKFWDYGVARGL